MHRNYCDKMKRMVCPFNWFNHLPIHNEEYIPDEFKKEKYLYCMNYPLIKRENKVLRQFENNLFVSSVTQEVATYAE